METSFSKERYEALETLRTAAWIEFDTRRPYEWKIPFGLWTAMAALVGVMLSSKETLPKPVCIISVILALVVIGAHSFFVLGVARSNHIARGKQSHLEGLMLGMLDVAYPEEVNSLILTAKRTSGKIRNYSHCFQVTITLVLACAAVLAVWLRT